MLTFSRLLKETGRFSNSPVFVVGIFSGADQLGEGFGASLRMAEFRVRSFNFFEIVSDTMSNPPGGRRCSHASISNTDTRGPNPTTITDLPLSTGRHLHTRPRGRIYRSANCSFRHSLWELREERGEARESFIGYFHTRACTLVRLSDI